MSAASPVLLLGASLACGAMIGIERGWSLRGAAPGTRVAGVRTYTLIGASGGVAALLGTLIDPAITVTLALAIAAVMVAGYWRHDENADATSFVAAIVALSLGLLAGAGEPLLAVAGGSVAMLVLASRAQSHGFVEKLNEKDVRSFARYAVIAAAVLPFLPNRQMGPLESWNPFQLWLVVLLVTGFSLAGYVANRLVGSRNGILATAIIGGAYSSTAVTASLARRLGRGEPGPLAAGITLASAVMYLRVIILVALLSPSTLGQFLMAIAPATAVAAIVAGVAWKRAPPSARDEAEVPGNPVELVPALGFVLIVALAAVVTRWAQVHFGEAGVATGLFITGSFDVDAAIVTLSGLPLEAIDRALAATAIAGTVAANMLLKIFIAVGYARSAGRTAAAALGASTAVLVITLAVRAIS